MVIALLGLTRVQVAGTVAVMKKAHEMNRIGNNFGM